MAREPFDRTWAEEPEVDQFGEPTDAMWRLGWEGGADKEPPEAYAQNYWQRRADITLRQLERDGALEWLASTPYKGLALARASDGVIYVAVQDNNGVDPTIDDGTNWLSFPDYIKSLINSDGPAPVFGVRAWANMDGTIYDAEGVVEIRASGNIDVVERLSEGRYQVTFSTPMLDADYSVSFNVSQEETGPVTQPDHANAYSFSPAGFEFRTTNGTAAPSFEGEAKLVTFSVIR